MLAIEINRYGGPEALRPVERPDPVPHGDELLVRNRWIGVNYVDLQHRAGRPYARIAGRFELARAAEAHERLASRDVLGKLLLRA